MNIFSYTLNPKNHKPKPAKHTLCLYYLYSLLQAAIDVLIFQLCLLIIPGHLSGYIRVFMTGTMSAVFFFTNLYGFKNLILLEECMCVLKSSVMMFLIYSLYLFTISFKVSLLHAAFVIMLFFPAVLTARYFYRSMLFSLGLLSKSVVVIGAGRTGASFAENVICSPFTLRKIAGFIDDAPEKQGKVISGVPVLGSMKNFARIQAQISADEAVIAITAISDSELAKILDALEGRAARVLTVPEVYTLSTPSSSAREGGAAPSQNLKNPANILVKTCIDYIGAVTALMIFSPVMLWAAWRIKKEDGGNILFYHPRAGKNLIPFGLCKFRTMRQDAAKMLAEMLKNDENLRAEFAQDFKLRDDPRITKIGHTLRKYSIDELPQLFNVLRGEMSLVGPRPIVHEEVRNYYGYALSRQVFSVKPGMTGLWQVSGRNDVKDYETRINYDMDYINNWSIWLDIVILLKTPLAVILKKGAY